MPEMSYKKWISEIEKLYKEIDAVCPDDFTDFYDDDYTPQEAFLEEVSRWGD